MAELLRNPEKLEKLRNEIQQVIDDEDIKIEESHVTKFPFLRAVVKETLCLPPPVPLLVPRKAQEDADICRFTVAKNAQILINVWAMAFRPISKVMIFNSFLLEVHPLIVNPSNV
ncbi:hypothetical protein K1719_038093 [Acacia pycnantha]|nr:hypothetical protein K1719_038093 [Acacia pycnantha]